MATIAGRKVSEMSISNWALALIRQKERMARRILFKVSTSQGLLGRFYEIINVPEAFSTWDGATSPSLVAAFVIPFYLHSHPALIHSTSTYDVFGTTCSPGDMTEAVPVLLALTLNRRNSKIHSCLCYP